MFIALAGTGRKEGELWHCLLEHLLGAVPAPWSQGTQTSYLEAQDSERQYSRNRAAALWPFMTRLQKLDSATSLCSVGQSNHKPSRVSGRDTEEDQGMCGHVFKPP